MALVLSVRGKEPEIGPNCFLAPNATIIGDVICGEYCSFWFCAVIRGDVNSIRIGNYSNIQDGAVIHATYEFSQAVIGNYVSIGHNAIVHGATLGDHILVGMSAVIMDHAIVEDYCIIAAGAVVLEYFLCQSGFVYAGVPARKIKPLTDDQRRNLEKTPLNYVMYSSWFTSAED